MHIDFGGETRRNMSIWKASLPNWTLLWNTHIHTNI